MKHVTSCSKLLPVLLITILVSCNSGTDKKDSKDTTAVANASQPQELKEEMFIKHKVVNYTKWKPLYDADSSNRLANGLHDHIVARGDEDPNTVMVIFYMDDVTKAKAMVADPKLKEVMQKAGVSGAPEIDYIHRVFNDSSKTDQSARVMIKHKVQDWDIWKKVFDDDKQARMDAGLSDRMVGYTVGDNRMVTIICVVNDEAKAKAFMNDKRLTDKMKAGGVEGPPSIFFYHVVEKHL
ncbi:MAG: hypothetical protein V4557_05995 [Bacteroidota bacterium]